MGTRERSGEGLLYVSADDQSVSSQSLSIPSTRPVPQVRGLACLAKSWRRWGCMDGGEGLGSTGAADGGQGGGPDLAGRGGLL